MAISVAPALCVEAMNVAMNSTRSAASSPCRFNLLNSPRGDARAGAILRTRTRLLAGQGGFRLGRGRKSSGLVGGERFGRFCVRASRGDEDKDLRFSQQVRERSDSEQEEEGLSNGGRVGEEVSVSAFHDEDSVVPDVGSRRRFRNRFLGLVKLRTNVAEAAEGVFKSEIRRRIFVTIVLLMASRAGYFVPLPGFDRRSMPGDYLGFVSGAVGENSSPCRSSSESFSPAVSSVAFGLCPSEPQVFLSRNSWLNYSSLMVDVLFCWSGFVLWTNVHSVQSFWLLKNRSARFSLPFLAS